MGFEGKEAKAASIGNKGFSLASIFGIAAKAAPKAAATDRLKEKRKEPAKEKVHVGKGMELNVDAAEAMANGYNFGDLN